MTGATWMPIVWTALAVVAAFFADRAVKSARPGGERGDFWVVVVKGVCWLGVLVWCSTWAESLTAWWETGLHLQFDRVLSSWWAFPLALAIPFIAWGVILLAASGQKPARRDTYGWLAGWAGLTRSRRWVWLCIVPFLVPIVLFGRQRLGTGADGYPAAAWGTMIVLAISLIFVGLSEGTIPTAQQAARTESPAEATPQLESWPEMMAAQGIRLEAITTWGPTNLPRRPSSSAAEFAERLEIMGARGVAAEVVEAVHGLLAPQAGSLGAPAYSLLFAPDHAGQAEAVALAAGDIAASFQESTLIITPRLDSSLQRSLTRWLPEPTHSHVARAQVLSIDARTDVPREAGVWIVDAATLSSDFMVRLADPTVISRIGLVVWWDIHEYTGVLAANAWAISRRLNRLVQGKGRVNVRTLVLVRDASHGGAQMSQFVRRLLPYRIEASQEIHVEQGYPRPVSVYLLRGHQSYFLRNPQSPIKPRVRYPEMVAALVSAGRSWPTCAEAGGEVPDSERVEVLNLRAGQELLKDVLREEVSECGARIRHIADGEILALPEILGRGGRGGDTKLAQHAALTLSENPYAMYVVSRFKDGEGLPASRRLLVAESHPSIFRQHLLLALSEQEDTRTGLKETLLWREEIVEQTLQQIAMQGKLGRRRVPFIAEGKREIEYLYTSTLARQYERRPLDTVEDKLVAVRPAVEAGIAPMYVDPARLAIRAYPGRVFLARGVRYRVRDWMFADRDWVECERLDGAIATWRERTSRVSRLTDKGNEQTVAERGLLMKQFPVRLQYQEDVIGYIRREYDLTAGTSHDESMRIAPKMTEFETSALVLQFDPPPEKEAIAVLCQALRHVLPVHLGVEEDAIEVVPLEGTYVGRQQVFGLAIVDLYPRGIGLVDALTVDPTWAPAILRWTRDWLASIDSRESAGANPFRSPMARAATGGGEDPRVALALLRQLLGAEPRPSKSKRAGGQ